MPRTTIRTDDVTDSQITNADMADDAVGVAELSATGTASTTTFLRGDNSWATVDTSGIDANKEDIALLAFQTQANGSLARYNLVDQSVDSFEDASGINAPASTDATRNVAGKYYSGGGGQVYPTGGAVTTHGSYRVHSFLSGSTNVVAAVAGTVDVLMVGGGGAGGSYHSGAGGAGGMIVGTGWTIPVGTHAAVVGAGGVGQSGNTSYAVNKGADSTFRGETALGGGGGGTYNTSGPNPYSGGSTGGSGGSACGGGPGTMTGAAGNQPNPTQPGTGYAYAGGNSHAAWTHAGGGGGGAGVAGTNASGGANAGDGGAGRDNDFRTGSNVTYAGGGGGGLWSGGSPGAGGTGGGGPGGTGQGAGTAGTANTGGGGGGFGGNNGTQVGASGGSGIIVIRYLATEFEVYADMILESNTITAEAAPTKADLVFTYTNGSGTAVLGTNITVEASMDGGTTWTDFAIAPGDTQGTTGGHTIVTKNNVTLTSTSGTSMRYRLKTLVQSAALETRIHAVSLGWS